jgi:hypothetical protein
VKVALHIPLHWPAAWWASDDSLVRMACPACGAFALFLDRTNGRPKLECRECHISGFGAVKAAFDRWTAAQNQPDDIEMTSHEAGYIRHKD